MRWTETDVADYQVRQQRKVMQTNPLSPVARVSKYRNTKTEVDGIKFDSKKEAARYQELITLQKAGKIKDLLLQVRMPIEIDGVRVCTYVCDFAYYEPNQGFGDPVGKWVYEDCKGMRTPVYLLKKKLVKALLKIDILET